MSSRLLIATLLGHLLVVGPAAAQSSDPRDQPKLPPATQPAPLPPAPPGSPSSSTPSPLAPAAPTGPANSTATQPTNPTATGTVPPSTPGATTTTTPAGPAMPGAMTTTTTPGAITPPGAMPPGGVAPGAMPPGAATGPTIPTGPIGGAVPANPPAADVTASGDPGYQARLRGLEEKVNELKEKVFSSKARLVLLQEAVLHGSVTGAYALLIHKNTMGSAYKLEYASYHLDGQPIYQPTDVSELEKKGEFPIFNGAIVPGSHTVSVYLVYRGASKVFAYWQGYQFKIKSSFTFHFEEGKITNIKVVGYEKGGVTIDMKDRPAVRFDVDVQKVTKSSAQGLGPQALPAGTPEVK